MADAAAPAADPDCVFCAILRGDVPGAMVFDEGDGGTCAAFLDRRPLFKGHTLLVPRVHHETLPDLPADTVGPLFVHAQRLATAMTTALGAKGSFVAMNNVVSQSVPHLHVHVVPRAPKDGLKGFFWPRTRYEDDTEMEEYADRIAAALRDAAG